jgi:hypothetical protein
MFFRSVLLATALVLGPIPSLQALAPSTAEAPSADEDELKDETVTIEKGSITYHVVGDYVIVSTEDFKTLVNSNREMAMEIRKRNAFYEACTEAINKRRM